MRRGTLYGVRMLRANSRMPSTPVLFASGSRTTAATTSSPEWSLGIDGGVDDVRVLA